MGLELTSPFFGGHPVRIMQCLDAYIFKTLKHVLKLALVLWPNQIQCSGVSSFNINALPSSYRETSDI